MDTPLCCTKVYMLLLCFGSRKHPPPPYMSGTFVLAPPPRPNPNYNPKTIHNTNHNPNPNHSPEAIHNPNHNPNPSPKQSNSC